MAEMDLIPGQYRKDLGLRRLVHRFITACGLALVAILAAKMLLTYLTWRENVQVVRLEQQQAVLDKNIAQTESFRQQKQVTEQQLAALNKLRGRDRVAMFLQAVDNAYNDGIWLDSVHFMRREGTGTLNNVPGATNSGIIVVPNGAEANQPLELNQGVDIVGHALNHSILAEFMRDLGAQPSVADLRLITTGTRNYTSMNVVDFTLALQVNDQAQLAAASQVQPQTQTPGQVQP